MQVPKYEQIAETLGREIREGIHPEGTLLPTEAQLSARFQVSRHTIRHGLRALRERGLVKSRQGRGTEVVRAQERSVGAGYHVVEGFAASPFDWPFHLEGVSTVTAADRADFDLPSGGPMLRLSGVFRDETAGWEAAARIYLDEACGDAVPHLAGGHLPTLLASLHGLRPTQILQEIRCEVSPDFASGLCRLVLTRRYLSPAGTVYMVLRAICPQATFALRSILSTAN